MPDWTPDERWGGLPVMYTVWAVVVLGLLAFTLWTIWMGDRHDVRKHGELAGTQSSFKEEQRLARIAARDARKAEAAVSETTHDGESPSRTAPPPSPNPLKDGDTAR